MFARDERCHHPKVTITSSEGRVEDHQVITADKHHVVEGSVVTNCK